MKSMKTVGHKREVFEGRAVHTAGGLTASDLMKNRRGKIVSRKRSEAAKKSFRDNKAFKMNMLAVKMARKSLGHGASFHEIKEASKHIKSRLHSEHHRR